MVAEAWDRAENCYVLAFPLCRPPKGTAGCPGTFSRSVVKCSIDSRRRTLCVSPFVSFDKRFFERGGLRRGGKAAAGGSCRSFYGSARGVTLPLPGRGEYSARGPR